MKLKQDMTKIQINYSKLTVELNKCEKLLIFVAKFRLQGGRMGSSLRHGIWVDVSCALHHRVCLAVYSMKPGSNNGTENLFKQN